MSTRERDEAAYRPRVGELVLDGRTGRTGIYMDTVGNEHYLRPPGGGREWTARPAHVGPAPETATAGSGAGVTAAPAPAAAAAAAAGEPPGRRRPAGRADPAARPAEAEHRAAAGPRAAGHHRGCRLDGSRVA